MWLQAVSQSEGDANKCPTCGGAICRRSFGEMYAGSFIHDGQRVEIRRTPAEGFADPIWLDALTQYFDGGLYRARPSDPYFARGGRLLHRAVWETAFGPIPDGCHVHHRDSEAGNNGIANLECMDRMEHLNLPKSYNPGLSEKARSRAAEWHGSEAGRLWHSQNAIRTKSWTKWKREPRSCLHCGKEFLCLIRANGHQQKFCNQTCKALAYRKRVAATRGR